MPFRAVVFDVGAVLIDWNPRHLYRRLIDDEAEIERFLSEVCTPEWNAGMDAGRPFAEGIAELVAHYPDQAQLIRAYREHWVEMLGGEIEGSAAVVRELRAEGVPVYALSNWPAETYLLTRPLYPILDEMDGILISGEVGLAKPDPAIYRLFLERFGLEAGEIVFVDDSAANVAAAQALGIESIRFESPAQARRELIRLGFPLEPQP